MGAKVQGEGILQGSLSLGGCNQGISLLPENTYVWTDPPRYTHTHARAHTRTHAQNGAQLWRLPAILLRGPFGL